MNEQEQTKREQLKELLTDLSQSQDILKDSNERTKYFSRLESIYSGTEDDRFRHYYSDIFSCLTMIDNGDFTGRLDVLAENIRILKDKYSPSSKGLDISKQINKLFDHTNLEIARLNYNKKINDRMAIGLKDLNEKTETAADAVEKIQKMQNEYITILGIFAAIVLAFTGGMTFSTSALENINAVSPYRLLTVVFIIGLILINLVWMLLDFISELNDKSLKRWWVIFIFDIIIIVGLALNFFAYKAHWLDDSLSEPVKQLQEEPAETEAATFSNTNEYFEGDSIASPNEGNYY